MTKTSSAPSRDAEFEAAIRRHDQALAALDQVIWIGAEPTFTNRFDESPEWLSEALGEHKQGYACRILKRLRERHPEALVLRTLGRQYAEEDRPRWSLGLYHPRNGDRLADGLPPDPLNEPCSCEAGRLRDFRRALIAVLDAAGWSATGFEVAGSLPLRVLFRRDGRQPTADPRAEPLLARPVLHEHPIPLDGAVDELAAQGDYLVALGCEKAADGSAVPCLELPAFDAVTEFRRFIRLVARAAKEAELPGLIWRGYPPPVDASIAWTTLTPDPAVLEINSAPSSDAARFLSLSRLLYATAEAEGLSPYRLQYTGEISDSGGGGQFTLGGPTPQTSPFFVTPEVLPRLIRYLNHHPGLSYWFAPAYLGSHSQSPRPDENVRESFSELAVALQQLAAREHPEPEFIWRCLSPFLVDTSGNAHRSELNIEKLWNPYLPGRGRLGLVEFRAFRMPRDPETATAIAVLLRALVAMLSRCDPAPELIDWGNRLHDRFALPFHMRRDLRRVFADLEANGLGLGEPLIQRLLNATERHLGDLQRDGWRLDLDQAIEFWPLLGDAASQEGGSSRLVDASTRRLQISLRPLAGGAAEPADWRLLIGRHRIPLRREEGPDGPLWIMGLRYRSFVPWIGLHPGLEAQTPIVLDLIPPGAKRALRITLHEWQPEGLPYDGLPDAFAEALRRRLERCVVEEIPLDRLGAGEPPPASALSEYCFDLRRV